MGYFSPIAPEISHDPLRRRLALLAIAVAGAVFAPAVGAAASQRLPALGPVVLPRDHGAHPGYQVEWWYTAGTVAPVHGHGPNYFWFATIWSGAPGMIARVNLVDLRSDQVVLSRQYLAVTPTHAGQTKLQVQGFALRWQPGNRGRGRWSVTAPTRAGRLTLRLTPSAPYVLHGHKGLIHQGPTGTSAYYSQPRLSATGSLALHGHRVAVAGLGWLDHQWGNFAFDPSALRWNWFACQFADGRDLMLYQFLDAHDRPSGQQAGTLVTATRTEHLKRFTIAGRAPFVQPSGAEARYPLRWRLSVPALESGPVIVRALARHQYIRNLFLPSFWEGAATISRGPPGSCIVESSREVASAL